MLTRPLHAEARQVRESELGSMISLICEAFELPLQRVRSIFYQDPYFDLERKRVMVLRGRVASCLTIVDAPLRIGSAMAPVAGIAGVATHPRWRRRGLASELLTSTLPVLREQGYCLAALFARDPEYYRRLGWALGSPQMRVRVPARHLPASPDAAQVSATAETDIPVLARLYETWLAPDTGSRERDARRWSYLLQNAQTTVLHRTTDSQGYAFLSMRAEDGELDIHVQELVAASDDARRALLGHIGTYLHVRDVVFTGGRCDPTLGFLLRELGPDAHPVADVLPGPMFRVVDFVGALRALRPNYAPFRGTLTLTCQDAQMGGALGAVVRGGRGGIEVEPAVDGAEVGAVVAGDVAAWSLVLCGGLSAAHAISVGALTSGSAAAADLAASLFPQRDLYIPITDHF